MDGIYDIFRGPDKIGKAEIRREGLYYRFRCCCNLTGQVIYRLTATCDDRTENLGIPVPEGDAFYLETRLPVSRFGKGVPVIQAVPRHPQKQDTFVPISPEEPFGYIERLENAILEKREGQIGAVIPEEE